MIVQADVPAAEMRVSIYTFYPHMPDGAASMFDAVDLADDAAACSYSHRLLREHKSATEVVVWDGDRRVYRLQRQWGVQSGVESQPGGT